MPQPQRRNDRYQHLPPSTGLHDDRPIDSVYAAICRTGPLAISRLFSINRRIGECFRGFTFIAFPTPESPVQLYLDCKQRFRSSVNDRFRLEPAPLGCPLIPHHWPPSRSFDTATRTKAGWRTAKCEASPPPRSSQMPGYSAYCLEDSC
jgi:hypothetical protein